MKAKSRLSGAGQALLKVGDLAVLLQVSPGTVYRLVREGELPAVRVGGQWRFRRDDCEEWLDGRCAPRHGADQD